MLMETFSFNLTVDDFTLNQKLKDIMQKLLLVIRSMKTQEQIPATRRYIDLWYKKYGTKNKELIEIYYKSRKQELR